MDNIKRIAVKELSNFFSSATAFIFLGTFLAVTLFVFFWVDTFFARNIADVRPLFEWMPVLMIFLVSALTMRMWSEERRSGTVEFLFTVPVSNFELVFGKFAACMLLVLTALILTLPVPLIVAFLGPLDWGPVIGGYLASIFLAAAYTAIGLHISSRTDNQIESVIISVLFCSSLVLIGSEPVTSLFGTDVAEILSLLGTGARFQSITRGIIDLRDLYYYLSLTGVFLTLNILGLESLRWAGNKSNKIHRGWILLSSLSIANFIAGNLWLQQVENARFDLTEGHIYSISGVTRKYLSSLKEPLLVRAYLSKNTHPALAPLFPRLRDLLKEYAIAAKGKLRLEFVDPLDNPDLEREANEKYGIKPCTFQTTSKYEANLTSSYFDLLVKYGDQFQHLNFRDIVDVKSRTDKDITVELRHPEYDITKAIKMVLYSYQAQGKPFEGIQQNIEFVGYLSSDDKLSDSLLKLKRALVSNLETLKEKSAGKFSYRIEDPEADGGKLAKHLQSDYGWRPLAASPASPQPAWFYLTMHPTSEPERVLVMGLPDDMRAEALEQNLTAGLKKFSRSFVKTVGVVEPPPPGLEMFAGLNYGKQFLALRDKMCRSYNMEVLNLSRGKIPENIDLLILLDPKNLDDKQLFAVDQFLMRGGTIIISTSKFDTSLLRPLTCRPLSSQIHDWLKHLGVELSDSMVLDPQCFPIAMPIYSYAAGYMVESNALLNYPYFVDIRADGMNKDLPVTSRLGQVTLSWASPISVSDKAAKTLRVSRLLQSSPGSWTSGSLSINPKVSEAHRLGFPEGKTKGRKLLGVALDGSFESYFKGKKSPLAEAGRAEPGAPANANAASAAEVVLEKSPDSARIILFSSNTFLSDTMLAMQSAALRNQYMNSLDLLENSVDWSLEDSGLLSIRGQGYFGRPLRVRDPGWQLVFENALYVVAAFELLIVWFITRALQQRARRRHKEIIREAMSRSSKEGMRL